MSPSAASSTDWGYFIIIIINIIIIIIIIILHGFVNPLYTSNFTNSENPDEMPHNAAFHQGLLRLFR